MKTIFEIRPYQAITPFTKTIYDMVARHNSGGYFLQLTAIEHQVLVIKSMKICKGIEVEINDNILMIAEDNKLAMTITEKEVMELDEVKRDLLTTKYSS